MADEYAIVLEGISKTFKNAEKPSVHETFLKIEKGSFVTILGASGCGKTTLLKMINRIYEPSSGKIYVNNEDVTKIPATVLRRKIGYVIQQTGLFRHMSIEENVATVPKILGWDKKRIDERIDYLLDLVGLDPKEYRKRYPSQLSGGQQQRVGLARAMAADPSIMLMDEPFGAIDAITRSNLQDEMIKIQKKLNKTIMFVTHDISEALKLGDKVIIMNEGKIQQYDKPLNILMNPANDFVKNLVNSDDVLQRLTFIKAKDVMAQPIEKKDEILVEMSKEDDLKTILSCILKNVCNSVAIHDEKNEIVGSITLDEIKKFSTQVV
ncbi:ABC transporter ATP-binding protein [Clostridium sp. DJ247]|uniref:ABC transporter ATP-binding protein n=1 Tax=Clostridium sp. DJ247 TaxID=2726188 RepID=UPI001629EEDC|nr:ABC transporter ATP-binding protein [Clostridium sp. DJ247]MBC2582637.1 ABC transporter ATP-binding protein [Clostridium sp. DJ247]